MANKPQITVKLVLLGESAVGKSSIVVTYVTNQYREYTEATIGAAFLTQTVALEDRTIKYEIWDTAGQERYHSLAPMYYRGAQAAVIVYDITNENSFARAKAWVQELKRQLTNGSDVIIALTANKSDRDSERKVSTEEGQQYAQSEGLLFIETSAKRNENISKLFLMIAEKIQVSTTMPANQNGLNLGNTPNNANRNSLFACCN